MLSMHKFGSNVIEKCLVHGDPKQKDELINEILNAKLSSDDINSSHSTTN
jgi:hypothetical protein